MAKIYYHFDTETSQFTRVQITLWHKFLKMLKVSMISLTGAVLLAFLYTQNFEMPGELKLKKELKELESDYQKLNQQLSNLNNVMTAIEKRDDQVYRVVLGVEPIDKAVRMGGVGGTDRYSDIHEKKMRNAESIATLYTKVDQLKRKLYIESVSQDELMGIVQDKQKFMAAVPAIQPISNKELKALASGFGPRMHPFYKVIKMHQGIDFSAPIGTPVYATADGKVVAADTAVVGYGTRVMLDHGFDYQTHYAHLNEFIVKPGDIVKRGELIAYVGNTGQSTAPHLHYEVLHQGEHINPINFFFNDLTPDEYEKIVKLASLQNQSMGN